MKENEYGFTEGFTPNPDVTASDEDIEQALYEIQQERMDMENKIISGEYKVIEGKVYNNYGNCMGYYR